MPEGGDDAKHVNTVPDLSIGRGPSVRVSGHPGSLVSQLIVETRD